MITRLPIKYCNLVFDVHFTPNFKLNIAVNHNEQQT